MLKNLVITRRLFLFCGGDPFYAALCIYINSIWRIFAGAFGHVFSYPYRNMKTFKYNGFYWRSRTGSQRDACRNKQTSLFYAIQITIYILIFAQIWKIHCTNVHIRCLPQPRKPHQALKWYWSLIWLDFDCDPPYHINRDFFFFERLTDVSRFRWMVNTNIIFFAYKLLETLDYEYYLNHNVFKYHNIFDMSEFILQRFFFW